MAATSEMMVYTRLLKQKKKRLKLLPKPMLPLQNYFRMYHKLAGMTGTAEQERCRVVEHL